jgi:hypothetical protein
MCVSPLRKKRKCNKQNYFTGQRLICNLLSTQWQYEICDIFFVTSFMHKRLGLSNFNCLSFGIGDMYRTLSLDCDGVAHSARIEKRRTNPNTKYKLQNTSNRYLIGRRADHSTSIAIKKSIHQNISFNHQFDIIFTWRDY